MGKQVNNFRLILSALIFLILVTITNLSAYALCEPLHYNNTNQNTIEVKVSQSNQLASIIDDANEGTNILL